MTRPGLTYSVADQSFEASKSLGILNVSLFAAVQQVIFQWRRRCLTSIRCP